MHISRAAYISLVIASAQVFTLLAANSTTSRECSKKLPQSKEVPAALLQSMLIQRLAPKSVAWRACYKKLVPTRRQSYKLYYGK